MDLPSPLPFSVPCPHCPALCVDKGRRRGQANQTNQVREKSGRGSKSQSSMIRRKTHRAGAESTPWHQERKRIDSIHPSGSYRYQDESEWMERSTGTITNQRRKKGKAPIIMDHPLPSSHFIVSFFLLFYFHYFHPSLGFPQHDEAVMCVLLCVYVNEMPVSELPQHTPIANAPPTHSLTLARWPPPPAPPRCS